jgi:hypothetical protein
MAAVNAAERKELLRARVKARPLADKIAGMGLARVAGKGAVWPKRVRHVVLPKLAGRGYVSLGVRQNEKLPGWISAADAVVKTVPKVKNHRGKSTLGRIAERYASSTYWAETKRLDLVKAYR